MYQAVNQEDFLNCYFEINPDSNCDSTMAFNALNTVLTNDEVTIDGKPVTFKLICDTYKIYCDLWDAQYEGTEAKFIPKPSSPNGKKNPNDFLQQELYKRKYENPRTGRDDYLFGGAKIDSLNEQLKTFLHETGL